MTVPEILRRLPPEELAKVEPLTKEEVEKALEQGRREREAAERAWAPPPSLPGISFT